METGIMDAIIGFVMLITLLFVSLHIVRWIIKNYICIILGILFAALLIIIIISFDWPTIPRIILGVWLSAFWIAIVVHGKEQKAAKHRQNFENKKNDAPTNVFHGGTGYEYCAKERKSPEHCNDIERGEKKNPTKFIPLSELRKQNAPPKPCYKNKPNVNYSEPSKEPAITTTKVGPTHYNTNSGGRHSPLERRTPNSGNISGHPRT